MTDAKEVMLTKDVDVDIKKNYSNYDNMKVV